MLAPLQLLPLASILLAILTIGFSCGIATYLNHIPMYSQISMCGMFPPERYLFTLGLDLVAFLIGSLLLLNHCRREKQSRKTNSVFGAGLHLGFGVFSAISLALMATVPVSEFPVAHVMFAVSFFVLLLIYQMMNTFFRISAATTLFGTFFSADMSTLIKESWMIFWMLCTLVGFVWWQGTGSSIAQYIAVASIMFHFAPYIWELQDTSMNLSVQEEGEDEAATWLRGGSVDRLVGDRASGVGAIASSSAGRMRRGPFWVAAGIVAVLAVLLGLVIAHLRLNVEGQQVQESMPKPHELRRTLPARRPHPYVYRGPAS